MFLPFIMPDLPTAVVTKGTLFKKKKKEKKENLFIKFVWLQVQALLEVLPNKLTADVLEQLRISKQTLVQLLELILDRVILFCFILFILS